MDARKLKIAQFLTLMLYPLVVGVFWGTWLSLSRSISAARTFVSIAGFASVLAGTLASK